jgi:hypothetical protein
MRPAQPAPQKKIPMPKVKKSFTQRDKDQFLRNSFDIIKNYFEQGVRELTETTPQIEADLEPIHRYKFVCSFYNTGQLVNRCKIWIGGPVFGESIAYYEGSDIKFDSDTSCNDWVTIEISSGGIGLKPSNIGFGTGLDRYDQVLSPEQCAEYFWKRATNKLAGS